MRAKSVPHTRVRELQDVHDERKGVVLPFSTFVDG